MRLFVGIALDAGPLTALEQVRQRLATAGGDLRWPRPADQHITLQFLGECNGEQAACVTARLGEVRSQRVPVRIAGLGFFERAGVFWAGVEPAAELLALQQRVTAATRGCGFAAEARPYRPHITLARTRGRIRGRAPGRGVAQLAALKQAVERTRIRLAAEFVAEEFSLYESFPSPEGSRYEVRARFPLGTA